MKGRAAILIACAQQQRDLVIGKTGEPGRHRGRAPAALIGEIIGGDRRSRLDRRDHDENALYFWLSITKLDQVEETTSLGCRATRDPNHRRLPEGRTPKGVTLTDVHSWS